jgi:hypothetical protein
MMGRTTVFTRSLGPLVVAAMMPCAGCVAPVIVSGVDAEVCEIIAPGGMASPMPAQAELVEDQRAGVRPAEPGQTAPAKQQGARAEPRKFAPADLIALEGNQQPRLARSIVAEQIPSAMPISPLERAQPAGHTLPPRVSPGQSPTMTPGEPTAELPTAQRIKPLREISLDITPPALLSDQQQPIAPPIDYAAEALPQIAAEQPFVRGEFAAAGFDWHPSPASLSFCYQPLYFEEVNPERYGHSFGILQPAVSAVAFYGRIPLLPYMAFARPARRCTYHAHWTLPGYKIPRWEPQPIVPSVTGAAAEMAFIYGLVLLIP